MSARMKGEIQRLSKWKNVADAEQRAAEMTHAAQAAWVRANADVQNMIASAQSQAGDLLLDCPAEIGSDNGRSEEKIEVAQ